MDSLHIGTWYSYAPIWKVGQACKVCGRWFPGELWQDPDALSLDPAAAMRAESRLPMSLLMLCSMGHTD